MPVVPCFLFPVLSGSMDMFGIAYLEDRKLLITSELGGGGYPVSYYSHIYIDLKPNVKNRQFITPLFYKQCESFT